MNRIRARKRWFMAAVYTLLPILGNTDVTAEDALSVDYAMQCFKECLKYRDEHFGTGHVRLHKVENVESKNRPGELDRSEVEYEICFDGEYFRFDVLQRLPNGKEELEKYLIEGEKYTWITPAKFGATKGLVSDYEDIYAHFGLFHPRWLGQGVTSESILQRMPKVRLPSERVFSKDLPLPAAISRVRLEDQDAVKVVYQIEAASSREGDARSSSLDENKGGTRRRPNGPRETIMWLVPKRGYSLVKAECRATLEGHVYVWSVRRELEQMPETGVWYPRRVERLYTFDRQIKRQAIITVKDAVFGKIDRNAFTLAAMDPPKGKEIHDRSEGDIAKKYVWNGEEAVLIPGPYDAQIEPAPGLGARLWLLFAFTLALVTCLAIWRLRAGRSRTTSQSSSKGES